MTERTFTPSNSGPIVLGLDLPFGYVHVQVLDSVTTANVTLSTEDETGPAADAVARARSRQDGQTLAVEVPEISADVVTQTMHGGRVVQNMSVVSGSVTGVTMVGGRIITGNTATMAPTVSPIVATVYLPAGSSLAVVTNSADAETFGYLDRVEFRSVSGNCRLDGVRELTAQTTSGDVTFGDVTERVTARSVSGDITASLYSGHAADLTTTSGDVHVSATGSSSGPLRAHSVSGDIHVHGGRHLNLSTRSVSGDVRTR